MRLRLLLACALIVSFGCDDTRLDADSGLPPGTDAGPPTDSAIPPGADTGPGFDAGPARDAGPPPAPSPLVDPTCVDGMFTETLPDPGVSLADLEASYDSANAAGFIGAVLSRRYTSGQVIVQGAAGQFGCPNSWLVRGTATPQAVYQAMSTVVHECGHGYDISLGNGFGEYYINDSPLVLSCEGGGPTANGGMTFPRRMLYSDSWSAARPPAQDGYADVYLDPGTGGSDQGFDSVLEETTQYINSIASSYAFTNELAGPSSVSERDGILTFLWYVERYLNMARTTQPSAYAHILNGDGGCWRRAVLTLWGRAWLYLQATAGMAHLGIDDDEIQALVETPELLAEIQLLRDAEGCPGQ